MTTFLGKQLPQTQLSPQQEAQFQSWVAIQKAIGHIHPQDDFHDYDMRGAWLNNLRASSNNHWSDQFKLPNHPTFSMDSQYAPQYPAQAGIWLGDTYLPPSSIDDMGI
jgi:hypothetical protein